jgi:hypothetical protein
MISFAHAPGYYLTLNSFALFDLSNRRFSKKIDLYQLFCFDRFLPAGQTIVTSKRKIRKALLHGM